MRIYILLITVLILTACLTSGRRNEVNGPAAAQDIDLPANIAQTSNRVHTLYSSIVGAEYKLYVGLPKDYFNTISFNPVIFVLDADYFFSVVQDIMRKGSENKELTQAIVVGITYPGVSEDKHGAIFEKSRTRDYTPTHLTHGGYGEEFQKVSGGADRFLDFLESELIPFLEKEYRILHQSRSLVGISYGELFASYTLMTRPRLFQNFVIISPSLWWDKRYVMKLADKPSPTLIDLPVRAFFSAGDEEKGPSAIMEDDIKTFNKQIESHKYPRFQSKVWVAPGKTHHNVFPRAAENGLKYLFGIPTPSIHAHSQNESMNSRGL